MTMIDTAPPFAPWTLRITATVVRHVMDRANEDAAWAAYRNYITALRAMKALGWQIESVNTHSLDIEWTGPLQFNCTCPVPLQSTDSRKCGRCGGPYN